VKTYKFFNEPRYHDAEFYKDREPADHIHEPLQRERLLRTVADVLFVLEMDEKLETLSDLGCGTAGLLWKLKHYSPETKAWGYDLSPKAVEFAKE
jgi:methylase of polypeptide subunit release factors